MSRARLLIATIRAACVVLAAHALGCQRPADQGTGAGAQAVRTVELVHPERHTVARKVGAPGQLVGFETTPIHAKIAGYVKSWMVNIGALVKKGQLLAELSVPEMDAELDQKQAAYKQAIAKHKQARAAVEVATANIAGAEARLAEARAGVGRAESDLVFWQSETRRAAELVKERAVTESVLDEARSKLHAAESSLEEVRAKVKTAEVALPQARAALDQAKADVAAADSAINARRRSTSPCRTARRKMTQPPSRKTFRPPCLLATGRIHKLVKSHRRQSR
jgi:multidrug efflux pump subunit AcrA (membrane-fusion protein)